MGGSADHERPFASRRGLDGLRGLAVALVVAFHVWPSVVPGGFLGVSLFFTLSGYLITSVVLAEHSSSGRLDLRRFWARRFRRLLPAALVTLGVVSVLAVWLPAPENLHEQVLAAVANVYNWWLIRADTDYGSLFGAASPIEHFWSLAIEEQFYLVFPLVAVVLLRRGRRLFAGVIAVALVGSVLLTLARVLPAATAYFSTLTRSSEILFGVLLAVVIPLRRAEPEGTRTSTIVGMGAVAGIVALSFLVEYSDPIVSQGLLPMVAVLSCAAVVHCATRRSHLLFGGRVATWLGRRSYGIYLDPLAGRGVAARTGRGAGGGHARAGRALARGRGEAGAHPPGAAGAEGGRAGGGDRRGGRRRPGRAPA